MQIDLAARLNATLKISCKFEVSRHFQLSVENQVGGNDRGLCLSRRHAQVFLPTTNCRAKLLPLRSEYLITFALEQSSVLINKSLY